MSLAQISQILDGTLRPVSAEELTANRIAFDSRNITGGELFFALRGDRDGHDFILDAFRKGAVAAVVSDETSHEKPIIKVDDALVALGKLAREYRRSLQAKIVCITGSLGKTTCRRAIAQALSATLKTSESKGNFNNLIGLPYSILNIEATDEAAVLEVGINIPGEMAKLGEIAAPDYAVFLNVAPVHLEGLRNLETIAEEKLTLLKYLQPEGLAFLNIDDDRIAKQRIVPSTRIVTFGFDTGADYRITGTSLNDEGGTTVEVNGKAIKTSLHGRGAAYAVCSAFAVGTVFGLVADEIASALDNFRGLSDRLNIMKLTGVTLISDVYNSSPMAVLSALETLSNVKCNRRIAVLGDMLELGDEEIVYHRNMIADAVEMGIDKIFLFGNLCKSALDSGSFAENPNIAAFCDYSEMESSVMSSIETGDAVLAKASRAMRLERLVESILKRYEN
ncbi:MAG: UDP-N-acetylmuramoyl-tripeptide--D-alanyl-D-alanine ligase [bacterium]